MTNVDHNTAVRLIIDTLKGPVAEVFRSLIPAMSSLNGAEFYDIVMGDTDLLDGCITIFNKKRAAFAHLLVDADSRPVADEFVRLRCGRSLHDIMAMVVRAHAKRHFAERMGDDPNDPLSRSGRLYAAINEYLIHHWQIPLVPDYAALPVETVRRVGPALLDATNRLELARVTGSGARLPAIPQQAPAPAAASAEYWWEALHEPQVRAVITPRNEQEVREIAAALSEIGANTQSLLIAKLKLGRPEATVALGTARRTLGRGGFKSVFGTPGDAAAVTSVANKLSLLLGKDTGDLCALSTAMEQILAPLRRAA